MFSATPAPLGGLSSLQRVRGFFFLALLLHLVPALLAEEFRTIRAGDLRTFSREEAEKGIPVRLRATVIWSVDKSVFVQDETGGTYFRPGDLPRPRAGDQVEIEGKTVFGIYLPGIAARSIRVLGHGPLPKAYPSSYEALVSGEHHYQRVSVEGRVRAITPILDRGILRLSVGTRTLDVEIWFPLDQLGSIIDQRVRVEGLAVGTVPTNNKLRIVRPYLRAHSPDEITVIESGDPLDIPKVRGIQVLTYDATGREGQSVRVSGTVTATFPKGMIYLRDGTAAFGLRLSEPSPLRVGDVIDAIGYPEMQSFNTHIADARVEKRTPGTAPAPHALTKWEEYLRGTYANDLVTIEAIVADIFRADGSLNIVVRFGNKTSRIRVPDTEMELELGTHLRATGICVVESAYGSGFEEQPVSMSLVSRSPEDIEIISAPPWWNARRLTTLVLSISLIAVIAGIWIAALRRQVSQQTATIRSKIESEAALRERARIAREFHDTLAQNLTGLQLRLDAIASEHIEAPMEEMLTDSRHLVTRLQAETRNLVSDLRETNDSSRDLAGALIKLAHQNEISGSLPSVRTEIVGPPPALTPFSAYHLRMIAQESLTNALKHAEARAIVIGLATGPDRLTLTIADDGCGFSPAVLNRAEPGHFGCAGIRERSVRIGADVTWQSSPGRGTVVEVTFLLNQPVSRTHEVLTA